jgi:hypothetical protein
MPSVFIKYQVHTVQVGGSQTELRSPALRIATHKPGYRAQGRDLCAIIQGRCRLTVSSGPMLRPNTKLKTAHCEA